MNRFAVVASIALMGMVLCGSNALAAIDLTGGGYDYDIAAGTYDVTVISFDFDFGALYSPSAAFRIRRGDGGWLGSFNIHSTSFNLDTDYGPYTANGDLSGSNHYDFTLNSSNGLWDLAVNGVAIDFYPILSGGSVTANPQPNGDSVSTGSIVPNKFFSDESPESGQNAVDLGWATWTGGNPPLAGNAADGVGGNGTYKLVFVAAAGGSVNNITVTNTPEPGTMIVWGLLGMVAAGYGVWRRRR